MSDSQIGALPIIFWLVVIAYVIYRYIKNRNEKAQAAQVRALLRPRIDEYTKAGHLSAAKERYFSSAVQDDTVHGAPPEETAINKRRALEFEREGRSFILAAKTLQAVIDQPTKAEMIALMKRYVLEFGDHMAEQARLSARTADDREEEQIDTKGLQCAVVVAALKEILGEISRLEEGRTKMAAQGTWTEGLFRLWIVATVMWLLLVALVASLLAIDPRVYPGLIAIAAGGPPLVVLAIGSALVWAFRGFRKTRSYDGDFNALTMRILDVATANDVPINDSIVATAKAMGAMIGVLAKRPGTDGEGLLKFCQDAVGQFAREAGLHEETKGSHFSS
jgi:hypothetical protein